MSGLEIPAAMMIASQLFKGFGKWSEADEEQAIAKQNAQYERAESMVRYQISAREGRQAVGRAEVIAGATGGANGSALDAIGAIAAGANYQARNAIYEGRRRYDAFKLRERSAKRRKTLAIVETAIGMGQTLATMGGGGGSSPGAAPAAKPAAGGL